MSKYLNSDAKFVCEGSTKVTFAAVDVRPIAALSKISGKFALTDATILVNKAPGTQCLVAPPTPAGPVLCPCAVIPPTWKGASPSVKISGAKALIETSSSRCPLTASKISPIATTYKTNIVDDDPSVAHAMEAEIAAARKNGVSAGTPSHEEVSLRDKTDGNVPENSKSQTKEEKQEDPEPEPLCKGKRCKRSATCRYMNASSTLAEERQNSTVLRENMEAESWYSNDSAPIVETVYDDKSVISKLPNKPNDEAAIAPIHYSIAHHHMIPAKLCFAKYPMLVKLANRFDIDINEAFNGICLPMPGVHIKGDGSMAGYASLRDVDKEKISYFAMDVMAKQWHNGSHSYNIDDIINDDLYRKLLSAAEDSQIQKSGGAEIEVYAVLVKNELVSLSKKMKDAIGVDEDDDFCVEDNAESIKIELRNRLIKLADRIRRKIEGFSEYYVSRDALLFKYRDVLSRAINDSVEDLVDDLTGGSQLREAVSQELEAMGLSNDEKLKVYSEIKKIIG